jgi:hypothetical protein
MEKAWWTLWFTWFGPPECNTLCARSECCIVVCYSSLELNLSERACLESVSTLSFYTSRQGSYKMTRGPTCGTEVVGTLVQHLVY